jgi:DNA-binding NarL/FixJ family response regulator
MRVAIVDDGDWIRGMIVENLTSRGVEVVASVCSSEKLLAALGSDPVDVAIVDMKMPAAPASLAWAPGLGDGDSDTYEGLRLATEVQRRWPDVGVLILTNVPDLFSARYVDEELRGGRGYWSKDAPSRDDDVLTALRAINSGEVSFEPRYREDLERRKSTLIETLSTRERAILDLMREGVMSAPAVAKRLGGIAAGTVKTHKENIYEKLGLRARPDGSASGGESADDDRHGLAVKAVLMLERYLASPARDATKAP